MELQLPCSSDSGVSSNTTVRENQKPETRKRPRPSGFWFLVSILAVRTAFSTSFGMRFSLDRATTLSHDPRHVDVNARGIMAYVMLGRMNHTVTGPSQRCVRRLQRSIGRLQRSVGRLQRSVGRLQRSVGRLQRSIGRLQRSIGRLQRSVGRLQRSDGLNGRFHRTTATFR
jgi:HAMP domain-containing protein